MVQNTTIKMITSASPNPSDALAEQFIQELEQYTDIKKNWNDATELRKVKLGRDSQKYSEFRGSLKNKLTTLIGSERNGWVRMTDGRPPIKHDVELWLMDNTIVLQAQLKNSTYDVINVVHDDAAVKITDILCWRSRTYPGEFGRGEILKSNTIIDVREEDYPIDTGSSGNE